MSLARYVIEVDNEKFVGAVALESNGGMNVGLSLVNLFTMGSMGQEPLPDPKARLKRAGVTVVTLWRREAPSSEQSPSATMPPSRND